MKYDVWKVNKINRGNEDDQEFTATGLFINKGQRLGYRDIAGVLNLDGPVIQMAVTQSGTILVETNKNQYMIKQLFDNKELH